MGGQTALNLCIECDKAGIWQHYGVKIIGVDINAIETTEDREKFRLKMHELGVAFARCDCPSFLEGKEIARKLGFRWLSALLYLGWQQAVDSECRKILMRPQPWITCQPHSRGAGRSNPLRDGKSPGVARDGLAMMIIICSIENLIPGIHTGDSTVAI